jgi:Flp pilus assembly pilin Flp
MLKFFAQAQNAWWNMQDGEEGQTMAEYALVLALIAAVTAAVFTDLGTAVKDKLTVIKDIVAK